ncbi:hypothetical protein J2Y69_003264 [Microbacterium resistens]|uniref:Uncharacterized protein n=1 Tax=Microbacterium resistens TaxID=156977 RepID=A0ABU1SGC2_9MICO|nr:hypothetical protein [Microbacterium resistens]MDR6868640.1 hypothetical protein [Microbacterium resistens]
MTDGISRRRVLEATAWSVPLVVTAVAVPAAAASTGQIAASFLDPVPGNGVRTISIVVVNTTESPSEAPVSVLVNAPGASQLMAAREAPGWTVAASRNTFTFTFTGSLPPNSSTTMEVDLLVDSEDDLLLIGELTAGSLRYPFHLSR